MLAIVRNPDVISCTVKSAGHRRDAREEADVEGCTEGSRLGSCSGGSEGWWRVRLTTGIVPDGAKPQSEVTALVALGELVLPGLSGDAVLMGVASEPPAMGIHGCATRPFGDIMLLDVIKWEFW